MPTASPPENGATTLDLFRGDADYGPVAFTRRHRFRQHVPRTSCRSARGRQFAGDIGRGLDLLVGGWDVTGVTLIQSARSSRRSSATAIRPGPTANTRGFTAAQQPDQVARAISRRPAADAWFNAAAFVKPPDNISASATPASASLIGPGTSVLSR